ncbi:hypothetical protein M0R88_09335 [Halorussus gelatinilyticus]|uniref:Uncharacterized protein n=1 Tax=Halorussus gelatinilyticus TaxID=2937524 RepID=A0A8U0INR7_9EURY|nr:hypothetical protein [Halorussus gelatinilyticus]UPW02275.1 hypothetical protein M0R88_09335 [Halorussus gelatinilyticus]
MTQKYRSFTETEMGDGTYVVAEPVSQTDDAVRIEAGWFDTEDDIEGEWEDPIGAIIRNDLTGGMELTEGTGTLSRRQAVENLADATKDGEPLVSGETEAEALIDYFAANDVLELDEKNDDVVLLKDPNEVSGKMVLNWAAAMAACVDKIDETMNRFERAKEKLQKHMENVDANPQRTEELMKEKAQELMALGDGSGFPDRSELSEQAQQKYDILREDFIYYKKLNEAGQENVSTAQQGVDQIANIIQKLEGAREVLDQKQGQVRTRALKERVFPESEVNIAMNMGELVTSLAGVGSIEEEAENMSEDDVESAVTDVLSDAQNIEGALDDTLGDESEAQEGQEGQASEFTV